MKKRLGIVLAVILSIALLVPMTSTVMAAYPYDQPGDGDYLAATTLIDISGIPDSTTLTSVSDGTLTVDFDQTMTKTQVGVGWATWGSPPATEKPNPHILYQTASDDLTMDLSMPCRIFGFELEPNLMAPFEYNVNFILKYGPTVVATITKTITGFGGAQLIALNAEGEIFDQVVIDGQEGTLGLAVAQLRYNGNFADLSITKYDHPDPVIAGELLYYDIYVTNHGPSYASGVWVEDYLPDGVIFQIADTDWWWVTDNQFHFELGGIPAGETRMFTIQAKVDPNLVTALGIGPAATITNHADCGAFQEDYDPTNNHAETTTIVNEKADLKITKDIKPDDTFQAGTQAECTIWIDNLGPSTARNVTLTDNFLTVLPYPQFEIQDVIPSVPVQLTTTYYPGGCEITGGLGDLAKGERITVRILFTATETQDINNYASVSSVTPDENQSNNEAQDSVKVGDTANLGIRKVGEPEVIAGNHMMYLLQVWNDGPSTATNVVVEDVLPANVVIDSIMSPVGSWVPGVPGDPSQPTTFNLGNIPNGGGVPLEIHVTVLPQTMPGTLHNSAEVSGAEFDQDTSNNITSFDTSVITSADLSIDKWANLGGGDMTAGEEVTYTVTVKNNGPSTARDVLMFDYLSPYVTLVDVSIPSGGTWDEFAPNNLRCGLNDIDPNDSVVVFITVMVDSSVQPGTMIHNRATVLSPTTDDPVEENNEAVDDTGVITEADLMIEKVGIPGTAIAGEHLDYVITVTNNGPSDASDVSVIDLLPEGLLFVGAVGDMEDYEELAPGVYDFDLGDMAAGEERTFTINVIVHPDAVFYIGGNTTDKVTICNEAGVLANPDNDPDLDNNEVETCTFVTEEADLKIIKDIKPDDTVLAGDWAICTIIIENNGPSAARNVWLNDTFLSDGSFEFGLITHDPPHPWDYMTPNIYNPYPEDYTGVVLAGWSYLAPGDRITVKIPFRAFEAQDINNTDATVGSDTHDPYLLNNEASDSVTVVAVADLEIIKDGDPHAVVAGESLTYTLSVWNHGPSEATDVVVRDWLPANVVIFDIDCPMGISYQAGVPGDPFRPTTFNLGNMSPDPEPIVLTIEVFVLPQTVDGTTLFNDAEVSSAAFDDYMGNNIVSLGTLVEAEADLGITKTDSPDPVIAGEELTYTLRIDNYGPSTATDVLLTDTLPDEVTVVDVSISHGSGTWAVLNEDPPFIVECYLNDLDPGDFVLVYVTVLVDPSVPAGSPIENAAAVSAVTADPDGENNNAGTTTTVGAEADLMIEKDINFETGNPSTTIIYFLTVTNMGPSDAQNVEVTDWLPSVIKGGKEKVEFVFTTVGDYFAGPPHCVFYDHGTLAAGHSFTVEIHIQVPGSQKGLLWNYAVVVSSTTDPGPHPNSVLKSATVKGGSDRPGGPKGGRGHNK